MEILTALGVDWTLFIHIVCFAISYFFLSTFVLKPYMKALHEREKRTIGNEEAAIRLIGDANQLQETYEQKAKAINAQIKGHYDQSRAEAMKQYDEMVEKARLDAASLLQASQQQIGKEIDSARTKLSAEIPAVSAAIASKLAGKEISL
jgi:F0F1-type ATP synthase membrane subunit b/b'